MGPAMTGEGCPPGLVGSEPPQTYAGRLDDAQVLRSTLAHKCRNGPGINVGGGCYRLCFRELKEADMAKGNRRDVVPGEGGKGWNVTRPGAEKPVSHHRTQANADRAAGGDLRRTGSGERVTHRRDGTIRSKDTIPPAKDPNTPKDREH